MKLCGNASFRAGRLTEALAYYTDAQELLLVTELDGEKLDSVLAANCAAVFLKIGDFNRALGSAESAIADDPGNVKAQLRGAQASRGLGLLVQAARFCDRGLKLSPQNAELRRMQAVLQQEYSERV